MGAGRLRGVCLGFNGAVEEFPFGRNPDVSTFKVGGKIFALSTLTDTPPLRVSLKCDPDLAVRLRNDHPAIAPGYHLNKRHWNTVTLDGSLPEAMVRDLIEDSYDLVVASLPRLQRLRLDWPGQRERNREDG
ncbi:MmcQ/YjbR family DNA-binding protein [Embleya sp. MST-111070]|uniref:MmcQ/YjbR family DNA-binding protein n=1 Tax=Embleya sp. MST-111070 TaxID=3398231 RepID=UPI003F740BF8